MALKDKLPSKSILKRKVTDQFRVASQGSMRSVTFSNRGRVRKFDPKERLKMAVKEELKAKELKKDRKHGKKEYSDTGNNLMGNLKPLKNSNPSMFLLSHRTIGKEQIYYHEQTDLPKK